MVPIGTVLEVGAMVRRGLKAMVEDGAFQAALQKLGERLQYLSAEALAQFLEEDY